MEQTITIKGKTLTYSPREISNETNLPLNIPIATKALCLFNRIMQEQKLPFSLFFGTLLGSVRELGFIPHDQDIDVIVSEKDEGHLLDTIPILQENGFEFIRYNTGISDGKPCVIYSFGWQDIYIDIYLSYKFGSIITVLGRSFPQKSMEPYQQIQFLNEEFRVPANPEAIITSMYGSDWRTPIVNFNSGIPIKYNIFRKFSSCILRIFFTESARKKIHIIKEKAYHFLLKLKK